MNITQVPSPNYYTGRDSFKPIAIVIHIMEGTLASTDSWFKTTESRVSAHYGVGKDGGVHQYVQEKDSAWHAGRVFAPGWQLLQPDGNGGYHNPNLYTIGIEHEGFESTDWTDATYQASSTLIRDISARWNIPIDRDHLIGHHEIFARKACPGGKVDFKKLIFMATHPDAPSPPPPDAPDKVLQLGRTTTVTRLHLRAGPSRNQAPVDTIDAGVELSFDGYTLKGESVSGNSKWYYTADNRWFWSGGVK